MSLATLHRSCAARRWFGVLVVLAFGLRALAPTGFMLERVEGHLTFALCDGLAPALQLPGMPHHHATMAHPSGLADADTPSSSSQAGAHAGHVAASGACPFALSGGAAFGSQAPAPAAPWFVLVRPAAAPAVVSLPASPPPRHQAPRGPPALV
jgi:hypothetical protein